MKVYVATRGDEFGVGRTLAAYALLEAAGHVITYKWTENVLEAKAAGHTNDETVPRTHKRDCARADLDGVTDARAFIYLAPHEKSEGAAAELGAAIVHEYFQGTPLTIIVGEHPKSTLFTTLGTHHVESVEEAIQIMAAVEGNPLSIGYPFSRKTRIA